MNDIINSENLRDRLLSDKVNNLWPKLTEKQWDLVIEAMQRSIEEGDIEVELEQAWYDGRDDGWHSGYDEGLIEGYDDGYNCALADIAILADDPTDV